MQFRNKYLGVCVAADKKREILTGDWRIKRPVTTVSKCCECGWCYIYCPQGCRTDKGKYYEPDLDYCKGCGICALICPVKAITMIIEERE